MKPGLIVTWNETLEGKGIYERSGEIIDASWSSENQTYMLLILPNPCIYRDSDNKNIFDDTKLVVQKRQDVKLRLKF